uniref:Putative disease resistance protein n=1 Tax=Noccaea caerulescens TaxID=107243 RepID=A0A1J3HBT9_NOCCA
MALVVFFFIVICLGLRRLLLLHFHRRKETKQVLHHVTFADASPSVEASPPSLTSSSSRPLWKYDVFLSFRGTDVRKGFLSHLYKALTDKGIHTFRDDTELQRGNFISSALLEAIEQSRFAVVVLSQNYATSRWCLQELVHITKCVKKKHIELIPVFFGVDPSHVKKQSGNFAKAFAEHDKRPDTETVETWRKAMAKVGLISGWDSRIWNEESKLIEELVQDLSDRLFLPASSSDTGELIGMSTHMRSIYPLMRIDPNDSRMVGIWGMGGIGKTTIAKHVYKVFSREFDGACLLENVKREFRRYGPSHLREKILSEIFRKKDMNTWNKDSDVMKQRLRGKKVLLVLDDVDDIQQLEELAGNPQWFGPGSRIIITTRDRRVLDQHDVERIYQVKPLRTTQALQLFSKHAFKKPRPCEEYRELSIDVVEQLGGLPLALQVVGGSLYRRELEFWQDKLVLLKNNSDDALLKALRVSYEALDELEKKIFLYIALCFNGVYMDRVRKVLDLFFVSSRRRAFPTRPSIVSLMEKCMISLSSTKRLWVHDLLQDIAEDIICEGNDERPWKRLMLWDFEDINHVFSTNMGDEAIEVESIFLDMSNGNELNITPEIFERMPNLKLLKFYTNSSVGESRIRMLDGLDYLPNLRYLRWDACNLKSLPSRFCTSFLVELNLSHSSIETVWTGTQQDLANLRNLNLTSCKHLTGFPDLSKATNLETLKLSNCDNLVEIPDSSLRQLNKLVHLKLSNCKKLRSLPNNINLKSLKCLHLDGCSSVEEFPFISETVEKLLLNETSIQQVPPSIERLCRLKELRLSGCKKLMNLPDCIKNLKSLTDLGLAKCPNVTSFPEVGTNIRWLNLNSTAIEAVPSNVGDKTELLYLNMSGCDKLVNLPRTMGKLEQLKYLYLRGCTNVTESPELAGTSTMKALDLHGTSITTDQLVDSKSEEPQCEVPVIRRFFMKNVREHIKKRKSNR